MPIQFTKAGNEDWKSPLHIFWVKKCSHPFYIKWTAPNQRCKSQFKTHRGERICFINIFYQTPYWKIMDWSKFYGRVHFIYLGVSYILFLVDIPTANNGLLQNPSWKSRFKIFRGNRVYNIIRKPYSEIMNWSI